MQMCADLITFLIWSRKHFIAKDPSPFKMSRMSRNRYYGIRPPLPGLLGRAALLRLQFLFFLFSFLHRNSHGERERERERERGRGKPIFWPCPLAKRIASDKFLLGGGRAALSLPLLHLKELGGLTWRRTNSVVSVRLFLCIVSDYYPIIKF